MTLLPSYFKDGRLAVPSEKKMTSSIGISTKRFPATKTTAAPRRRFDLHDRDDCWRESRDRDVTTRLSFITSERRDVNVECALAMMRKEEDELTVGWDRQTDTHMSRNDVTSLAPWNYRTAITDGRRRNRATRSPAV